MPHGISITAATASPSPAGNPRQKCTGEATVSASIASALVATGAPPTIGRTGTPVHGSSAISTNQNHFILFTHPPVRRGDARDQDTIPDMPATAARITCPLAMMDADAFAHAHRDRRLRCAFRLIGALGALALAFVQSLDGLVSYHDGRYVTIPIPLVVCWVAGELAVALRRAWRARQPRIPPARVISTHRHARG